MNQKTNFDKNLVGKNIKHLIASKNDKISEIESGAEVSNGYLSRMIKDEGKSSFPIMDVLFYVANKYQVSILTLLTVDLTALTPNEKFLVSFFDRIIEESNSNKIVWTQETLKQLNDYEHLGFHPLFSLKDPYDYNSGLQYKSMFDISVEIAGDCFNVPISDSILYLMRTKNTSTENSGFELYFYSRTKLEPICNADNNSPLYSIIENIYNLAAESSRHLKLSDSVKSTINNYLNPDDIPF